MAGQVWAIKNGFAKFIPRQWLTEGQYDWRIGDYCIYKGKRWLIQDIYAVDDVKVNISRGAKRKFVSAKKLDPLL